MRQFVLSTVLFLNCVAAAAEPPDPTGQDKLLLTNLRVFDATSGQFTQPQNIYIDGANIDFVGIVWDAPFDGYVVNCEGKYAVPGLFDCHVHFAQLTKLGSDSAETKLEEFVAHGVTSVRDVGGPIDLVSKLGSEIKSGEIVGPEMFYAGPMLERSPLTWANHNDALPGFTLAVDSIEVVDSILPDLARQGARLVKTFNKMDPPVYRHLVEVAHQYSLRVVHDPGGPLFHSIPMDLAIDMGVTSIEHAKAPWPIVLNDTLLTEYNQLMSLPPDPMSSQMFMTKVASAGVESVSLERLTALGQTMKENGVFLCPTLHTLEYMEKMAIESSKEAMRLEELPEPMLMMIKKSIAGMEAVSRMFVSTLTGEGVKMLVGQDGVDPSATTAEMRHMKECGVREAEIIKGATIYPAQWLGVDDRLGSIAPHKVANLIVLDANPLEDIGNMEAVSFVIYRGEVIEQ